MEGQTSVYIGQHGVDPDRRLAFGRKEGMHAGKEESRRRKKDVERSTGGGTSCGKSGCTQHSTTSTSPPSPRGHNTTPPRSAATPFNFLLLHFLLIARARAHSPSTMDVVAAVSGYISKMVTAGESASGSSSTKMKILLLDSETVGLALD